MVSKPEGVTLGAQRVTGTHEASHHLAMPLPANSPPQPPGGLLSWAYSTVKLGPPPAPGQAVSIVSRLSGGRSSAEPSQRPHPEGPLTTPARTWEGVTQLVPRCGVHVTPRPASRAAVGPGWGHHCDPKEGRKEGQASFQGPEAPAQSSPHTGSRWAAGPVPQVCGILSSWVPWESPKHTATCLEGSPPPRA